jgi:hypothetical protein
MLNFSTMRWLRDDLADISGKSYVGETVKSMTTGELTTGELGELRRVETDGRYTPGGIDSQK